MQNWILYAMQFVSTRVIMEKVKGYAKIPGKIEIFTIKWSVNAPLNFELF